MSDIVFALGVALIIFLLIWTWEAKRYRDFERRWPPISDDEFVAKCSPGTDHQRALRVRRIIAEQLDIPYERVHPEQSFVDDLDCC